MYVVKAATIQHSHFKAYNKTGYKAKANPEQ